MSSREIGNKGLIFRPDFSALIAELFQCNIRSITHATVTAIDDDYIAIFLRGWHVFGGDQYAPSLIPCAIYYLSLLG